MASLLDENGNLALPRGSEREREREFISQLLGRQQTNVDKLDRAANQVEGMPQQMDLSPLLAIADSFNQDTSNASNYSKGYQKPQNPQERILTVAKLRELANQGQDKIGDSAIKLAMGRDKNETTLARYLASQMSSQEKMEKTQSMQINKLLGTLPSRFSNDKLIAPATLNQASLAKSRNLLNNESVPITPQVLSDAEQDAAAGMQLRGMGATEGKVTRTQLDTARRDFAVLMQKYGNQPDIDLRKVDPKTVEQVKKVVNALHDDYNETLGSRHRMLLDEYRGLYGDDERVTNRLDKFEAALKKNNPSWFKAAEAASEKMSLQAGGAPSRPDQVTEEDWAKATDQEKQALADHLGKK